MRLAVLALPLMALPALGDETATEDLGHWTVEPMRSSCVAYNRPFVEVEANAVNVMAFARDESGVVGLTVSFWPGALGFDDMELVLGFADAQVKLTADARRDYQSLRVDRLPDDVIAKLRTLPSDENTLEVTAFPSATTLIFDVSHAAAVIAALEACTAG
jgi:hypothetical protein